MCGIVGYFQIKKQNNIDIPRSIIAARDHMTHRGPNDAGLYESPDGLCTLGHRRLSILDLSPAGHQPMFNEDETLCLVFNGEIYNFMELREELTNNGHRFRSLTDSEVILHLFEDEGHALVHRLDGMFAFVLYDSKRLRLFGARDRLGIKPLYYTLSPKRFAFGSEPKALLALPDVSRDPCIEEMHTYLTFNCVPGPPTLFRDIQKLEPGTFFELTDEGHFTKERYWIPGKISNPKLTDVEVHTCLLADQLRQAIKKRMISDVPFGAMLSGGIDSSLTVALMSKALLEPVKTFTIGYPGDEADPESDLSYSRIVAQKFDTDHHEVILSENEILGSFDDLPALADDPIGAPSVTANLLLARFTKQSGVTVALVGEGADEVFCGYHPVHRLWRLHKQLAAFGHLIPRQVAGWLANIFGSSLERLGNPSLIGSMDGTILEHLRRYSRSEQLYWGFGVLFSTKEQEHLLGSRSLASNPYDCLIRRISEVPKFSQWPYLDQLTLIDLLLGLPERLLMRVDKATMLYSVEARVPFLDPDILHLAFQIPPNIRAPNPKGFLKAYAIQELPAEILSRSKIGFPTSQKIFLGPKVLPHIRDFILKKRFLEFTGFDRGILEQFFSGGRKRNSRFFYQMWSLYILSLWFHTWVEGNK